MRKWQLYKQSGFCFLITTRTVKAKFNAYIDILDSSTKFSLKYSHLNFWPLLIIFISTDFLKRCIFFIYGFKTYLEISEDIYIFQDLSQSSLLRARKVAKRDTWIPRQRGPQASFPPRSVHSATGAPVAWPLVREGFPTSGNSHVDSLLNFLNHTGAPDLPLLS